MYWYTTLTRPLQASHHHIHVVYWYTTLTRPDEPAVRRAPVMVTARASAASMRQRSGRAGRVAPGTSIRLISRELESRLAPHDPPEMLTAPLDAIVLKSKVLLSKLGPAEELLRDALEPPSNERVRDALLSLRRLGAVSADGGEVTPLGAFAARLPMIDISRARLLLMACLDGAACEGVLMAAALSGAQDIFTTPSAVMCKTTAEFYAAAKESLRRRREWDAGRGCDALATRAALLAWLAGPRTYKWAEGRGLVPRRLNTLASSVRGLARSVPAAAAAAAAATATAMTSTTTTPVPSNAAPSSSYSLPLNGAEALAWLERFAAPAHAGGGGGSRRAAREVMPPAGALASLDIPPALMPATTTAASSSSSTSTASTSKNNQLNLLNDIVARDNDDDDDENYIFNTTSARAAPQTAAAAAAAAAARAAVGAGAGAGANGGSGGEDGGAALNEPERARLNLTLLAVLGCPDNIAVGVTKPW